MANPTPDRPIFTSDFLAERKHYEQQQRLKVVTAPAADPDQIGDDGEAERQHYDKTQASGRRQD